MKEMVDSELIAGVRAGDPAAQHRFWQICYPIVRAICARALGTGFSANEVCVEVLDDFVGQYVHTLERPQAVITYLQLMAARRAIRERARLGRVGNTDPEDYANAAMPSPEESAGSHELIPKLEGCLGKLTDKAQQAIKLRYYDDLTNSDIAVRLGASKQYIGRLLTVSMVALRRCLERSPRLALGRGTEVNCEPAFGQVVRR